MKDDVRRAFAFMRRADIAGTRTERFRWGTAVFDEELALRYDSNYLLLKRRPDGVDALLAEADRLQGGAGLGHRAIVVPDEALGAALEPSFRDRPGWLVQRHLVMVHRRASERPREDVAVEEVDEAALRPPRTREILARPWGTEELATQLLDVKLRIAERLRARFFAVVEAGAPVSWTDLYATGGEAQVEDVATAPEARGRGLATAVVLRAVAAAREEEGAGFVFLVADDEDWPKRLYAKLGFDEAGRYFKFVHTGQGSSV